MSRMVDVKKTHRGVLLWREDILKCERTLKRPLSGFVRELLHGAVAGYELDCDGKDALARQVEMAMEERRLKHPGGRRRGRRNRTLTVDVAAFPKKVRGKAVFVKG